MKKNIALTISLAALILFILIFKITINKDKTLGGKPLGNGLYFYDLDLKDSYLNDFTIINEEVYYLISNNINEESSVYELYKMNIYSNNKKNLKEIKDQSICYLNEEQINCKENKKNSLYDLNLNLVIEYVSINEDDSQSEIIPYKDNYLVIENNNLYLLKEKKTFFKTLDKLKAYNYINYYKTKENTYLLFSDEKKYYLYDINENEFKELNYKNYKKYQNGFFFLNEETIKIIDLKNNSEIEYPNILEKTDFSSGTMSLDNEILYVFDSDKNVFYFEDLKNKTIIEYKITLQENNSVNKIIIANKLLYISDLENNLYIINLEEINSTEQNIEEYKKEEEKIVRNKIDEIKAKYNVNIKIKGETNIKYPDFYAEEIKDNYTILSAINHIENVLSKFNKEFFDTFYDLDYNGLNIYLTGTLSPSDYETQISNPAAFSLVFNNEYMIVLDIEQYNLEELTCHELEHNLENNSNRHNQILFEKWDELNPDNFYYSFSYTDESKANYTLSEENKENVYFIDKYAHTYPTEDRARVFESICAPNDVINLKDYPNLNTKAEYIKEEIMRLFPTLKNSLIFNN